MDIKILFKKKFYNLYSNIDMRIMYTNIKHNIKYYSITDIPKFTKKLSIYLSDLLLIKCLPKNIETLKIINNLDYIIEKWEIFSNIKNLTFKLCKINFDTLILLPKLETLCLDMCDVLSKNNNIIIKNSLLPSLKSNIEHRLFIYNFIYEIPIITYDNLNELELHGCNESTDIKKIFDNLQNLKTLNIQSIEYLNDDIFNNLSHLKSLSLSGNNNEIFLTKKIFNPISKSLESLRLSSINLKCYDIFDDMKSLKSLILCAFNSDYYNVLNNYSFYNLFQLEKLVLNYVDGINDDVFRYIPNIKKLELVSCKNKNLSSNGFKYLKNLKKLEVYNFNMSNYDSEYLTKLTKLIMGSCFKEYYLTDKFFMNLNNLEKLSIRYIDCEMLNECFKYIPNIKYINIFDSENINFIKNINILQYLKKIYIHNCDKKYHNMICDKYKKITNIKFF